MNDDMYDALAARVRDRRAKLDMSQQQVATVSGLTRSSVASIETGRQSVALHHVYALARALGTSPQELLPPAGPASSAVGSGRPLEVELFVASLAAGAPARRRKGA